MKRYITASKLGEYKVGQILNIGYYGGFHNQSKILTQAEVIDVDENYPYFITLKVFLSPDHGAFRKMFGGARDLKVLEENYIAWVNEGHYDVDRVNRSQQ